MLYRIQRPLILLFLFYQKTIYCFCIVFFSCFQEWLCKMRIVNRIRAVLGFQAECMAFIIYRTIFSFFVI